MFQGGKFSMRKIALLAVAFVVVAAGVVSADVDMLPYYISEQRNIVFAKNLQVGSNSIRAVFTLRGPETTAATHYGELQLDEAVDDAGTNLIPPKNNINENTKLQEFSNAWSRKEAKEKKGGLPVADPQITIMLAPAARAATKIARIRGTLSIADQGTLKTLELTGLKPGEKTKMDTPENAGVTITASIQKDNSLNVLDVEMIGNDGAVDSLEVQDAQGNKISNDNVWFTGHGAVRRIFHLDKPIDETMKLVVKISVDRTITKVPFDLTDIDLP